MIGKQEGPKMKSVKKNPSPYDLNLNDNPSNVITQVQQRGDNYKEWARAMHASLRAWRKWGFIEGTIKQPEADCWIRWLVDCSVHVGFMDPEYNWTKLAFNSVLCGERKKFMPGHQGAIFCHKWTSEPTIEIWTCWLQATGHVHNSLLWKIEDFVGRTGGLWTDPSMSL